MHQVTFDDDSIKALDEDIRGFIDRGVQPDDGEEREFNELALRLFHHQFSAIEPYQDVCRLQGYVPGEVERWDQIPAVPTKLFKELTLTTIDPNEAVSVFMSSGTKDPNRRSKVYMNDLGLRFYALSLQRTVDSYLFIEHDKLPAFMFCPPPEVAPNMALAYAFAAGMEEHLSEPPFYTVTGQKFDAETLMKRLEQVEERGEPVLLAGATFGFVHFIDVCKAQNISFSLPPGTLLCDSGGNKGLTREVGKEEFRDMACSFFGLEESRVLNALGMTEVSAGFIDNALYNHVHGIEKPRYKVNLPWTRTVAIDPLSFKRVPKGEKGLLRHFCLANRTTIAAIQTSDMGYEIDEGFEIIGRAAGTQLRGCSVAVDQMIGALKKKK